MADRPLKWLGLAGHATNPSSGRDRRIAQGNAAAARRLQQRRRQSGRSRSTSRRSGSRSAVRSHLILEAGAKRASLGDVSTTALYERPARVRSIPGRICAESYADYAKGCARYAA